MNKYILAVGASIIGAVIIHLYGKAEYSRGLTKSPDTALLKKYERLVDDYNQLAIQVTELVNERNILYAYKEMKDCE